MDIIKFSDSSGNVLIKSRRFEEDRYYSVFSVFGGVVLFVSKIISTKILSAKICGYFCFFEKCFKKAEAS